MYFGMFLCKNNIILLCLSQDPLNNRLLLGLWQFPYLWQFGAACNYLSIKHQPQHGSGDAQLNNLAIKVPDSGVSGAELSETRYHAMSLWLFCEAGGCRPSPHHWCVSERLSGPGP